MSGANIFGKALSAAGLDRMRREGRMTDLVIRTSGGGQRARAHRCLLVAACPSLEQQLAESHELDWSGYSAEHVPLLSSVTFHLL